ncbi:MAG: VIT domain-containing protein [Pseudomonadota bacterium]
MKKRFLGTIRKCWPFLVVFLAVSSAAWSQPGRPEQGDAAERTLSPYFLVQGDDPDTDRLPLKSTSADIKITGIIAEAAITQVYKNEGRNVLEAIYVFPGSTRAAVHALRMTIGERVVEAEIMERQKARETYEQAKQEGRTASLLEQQRPNVFQMNVANILPGDEIKVELKYTELLIPEDGVYEFVFPAVVGPRYSLVPAAGAPDEEKWVENPYLHQGKDAPYLFNLKVDLAAGLPISDLATPGNETNVEYAGPSRAHVSLSNPAQAAKKDFVARYRLTGAGIETGLMLYPGPDENFMLLLMEPPRRVEPRELVPREYIFIVDVSGSMNGFPLNDVAKPLMHDIINDLRPEDFMNVLLFAGSSAVLAPASSLPATAENKKKALAWLDSAQGGGGTNILPALRQALALPRTSGVSRIVTIITDGYVNVEAQAFELIANNLDQANLFALGVGSSVNRHLIEGLAAAGRGEPFVVMNPAQGPTAARKFRDYVNSPVLTDIKVKFDGLNAYDVEPAAVPDLFARRPLAIMGKYRGAPKGRISISGKTAEGEFTKVISLNAASEPSEEYSALPLLWARDRIRRISDLNQVSPADPLAQEIIGLGLKYHLMTQFTSFVAVDKIKRADGRVVTVKQPLPLPEGVSDLAVGGGMGQAANMPVPMMTRMTKSLDVATRETAPAVEDEQRLVKTEEAPVHVRLTVERITGGLDRAAVEKTLRDALRAFEVCLRREEFNKKIKIKGEATFKILLGPDGRVTGVKMTVSTLGAPDLETCLRVPFSALAFPSPRDGQAELTIKAKFNPQD